MKKNYSLLAILALALVIRLIFAFGWHEIWWDSGVYIGMGKYIYSQGQSGLWEHIRPPLVPIVLGFLWKTGLDPVLFGRLFEIILMLGIVWLTYQLAKFWWDGKTAIITALIIALSPIFYHLSFHQYTEIPSAFLVLLALWLFVKQKHAWAGATTGLAFLAKFPAGIFIIILVILLGLEKKWKSIAKIAAGFSLVILPYFIWSWIVYGSLFATLQAAQETISKALGCNVLRYKPWWQYAWWLVFTETKLHFMALVGILALWKKWRKEHLLFLLALTIPAIYFMQLNCRDYRYLTLFLPFIAMLTALGVVWAYEKLKIRKKYVFGILMIVLSAWMLYTSIQYYYGNEPQQPDQVAEKYFGYLQDGIQGEIWTANPIIAAYTDQKIEKMYYPIYGAETSKDFTDYVSTNHGKIGAILLDNCGGGIICPPDEEQCPEKTQKLIEELDKQFTKVFDEQSGNCWYKVWTTS